MNLGSRSEDVKGKAETFRGTGKEKFRLERVYRKRDR